MEDDYTYFEDENIQQGNDAPRTEEYHSGEESLDGHPGDFQDFTDDLQGGRGATGGISTSVDEMTTTLQQRIEEKLSQSGGGAQSIIDDYGTQLQKNVEQPPTVESSPVEIASLFEDNQKNNDEEFGSSEVAEEEIEELQNKAQGVEREEHHSSISFGGKICPTRHGCSGATSCDCSYGDYPH